ncbi:N-acyl-D-glucosamine 2-epimerase [Labilibaculum sp. A4]|uniref:AGE family epimerase/isomerase n=1 Tax=Labilibaculum euxinus TaxID=2686357 RepID=UPI000F625C65|nr:AGE family epimerase/isomerase [Labilibaculum euxinus]MDQ1772692.1 AGE family epimerase/isomerase [Labilibaculum euxinus]MWN76729.1 N-acyl-D-glucosamine 2-epimerase [Labilibaculum euxinus]
MSEENDSLEQFLDEIKKEWFDILDYWAESTIDKHNGGFLGEIDNSGVVNSKIAKGVVLNTRILWTFSSAYNYCKNERYLEIAKRAFDYILTYFFDHDNGGLFWAVDTAGQVVDDRKQAYAQGFGIYAFSEYYKASKDQRSLTHAINLFYLLESKYKDDEFGGYVEALSKDWKPLSDMRLSTKDANEPKSMNTHLHIIEPYTNLYKVWENIELKNSIKDLLAIFYNRILNQQTFQFQLFFDMDWTVKSNEISFGHNIESAWLLSDAARVIHDEKWIEKMETIAVQVTDKVIHDGMDRDGSVFYEKIDGVIDKDKHWWVQAEAIIGLVDTYKITGNKKYLDRAIQIWTFVKANIKDGKGGEWFWRVDAAGKPVASDCKVGFWKCPYHNTRALIESYSRLKE